MKGLFKKKQQPEGVVGDDTPEQRFIRESNEWSRAGRRPVVYGAEYRTVEDDNPHSQQAASPPLGYNSNAAFGRTAGGAGGEAYEARPEAMGRVDSSGNDQSSTGGGAAGKKKGGLLSRLGGKKSDSSTSISQQHSPNNGRSQPGPQWTNASRHSGPAYAGQPHRQGSGRRIDLKIGWLCATGNDDWSRVLEMCDEVSRSEAESKDAAKALRKEIKYGTAETQERALRLTAIMMWNTSDRFRLQIASKRFLEVIEDLNKSSKTDPRVREMLYKAFAALAYDFQRDGDLAAITATYNKIRPLDAPMNGHPVDENDTTFDPTTMPRRHRSSRSRATWQPHQAPQRDIIAESEIARNNAKLLIEALAFTSPAELDGNDIIREFHAKCLQSQNQLLDDIPWATAQAEQSRANRPSAPPAAAEPPAPSVPVSTRPFSSTNPYASLVGQDQVGAPQPPPSAASDETKEEKILAALLAAHGDLMEAFKQHEELEKLARNERELQEVEERSKLETRFDRSKAVQRDHGEWEDRGRGYLGVDGPVASGSRSPSPAPGASSMSPRIDAGGSGSSSSSSDGRSPPTGTAYIHRPTTPPRLETPASGGAQGYDVDEPLLGEARPSQDKYTSEPDAMPELAHSSHFASSHYTSPNRRTALTDTTNSTSSNGTAGSPYNFSSNNPFASAAAAHTSGSSAPLSDSPTTDAHHSMPRSGTMDSVIVTPVEPSEKAKGKMRRFSGMDGDIDAEERQREEEEKLRQRYLQ